ncbi:Uncharacterised protein [Mycobacteroides abscessus subsp. abscessus]|nr:Uncharacterised protein [Mycobacteroides abscessus subsp. abscessus]
MVEVGGAEGGHVDGQGGGRGATQQCQRGAVGAGVQHDGGGLGVDHPVQYGLRFGFGQRPHGVQGTDTAQRAREDRAQRGLVQLQHHLGAESRPHLLGVPGQTLGQRIRQVADRTGIGQRTMAVGQFDLGGQRERTGRLQLEHPSGTRRPRGLPRFFERVQVGAQQVTGAPGDRAGPRSEAVAAGAGVEAQIDQQGRHPADHVRADAALGQFHQVRQIGQFAEHGGGGLPRIGTRP